ncbi:MAG TPA: hypothetical protein VK608_04220, partial [Edaphobacter sp.]|nr:hypothetical protein [Edaphobacter sp.]
MKILAGVWTVVIWIVGSVATAQVAADGAPAGAAAEQDTLSLSGRRPMSFADLQRMKRLSDPQISPSGKWVMFSAVDVDLTANTKVSHLWVVPMAGG